jgi:hypothetical protein
MDSTWNLWGRVKYTSIVGNYSVSVCWSIGLPTLSTSQSVSLPTPSTSQSDHLPFHSAHVGSGQLPKEMWQDFMIRQNIQRKKILSKENNVMCRAREDWENSAATKSCPGKKGSTVFIWEKNGGAWTQTILTRGQIQK